MQKNGPRQFFRLKNVIWRWKWAHLVKLIKLIKVAFLFEKSEMSCLVPFFCTYPRLCLLTSSESPIASPRSCRHMPYKSVCLTSYNYVFHNYRSQKASPDYSQIASLCPHRGILVGYCGQTGPFWSRYNPARDLYGISMGQSGHKLPTQAHSYPEWAPYGIGMGFAWAWACPYGPRSNPCFTPIKIPVKSQSGLGMGRPG